MSDDRAADLSKSASADSGAPQPPAANQAKDEPIASAPDESPQSSDGEAGAGEASRAAGEQGTPPRSMEVDDVRGAANMATAATMPGTASGGVPVPGDSKGVSVPSVQAAAGTSEESESVDGVRITALAPPGKPDGEVDTRG